MIALNNGTSLKHGIGKLTESLNRACALIGLAVAPESVSSGTSDAVQKLRDKAGLADARTAGDDDDMRGSGRRPFKRPLQQSQVLIATRQQRQALRGTGSKARRVRYTVANSENRQRFIVAAPDIQPFARADVEERDVAAKGRFAYQYLPRAGALAKM